MDESSLDILLLGILELKPRDARGVVLEVSNRQLDWFVPVDDKIISEHLDGLLEKGYLIRRQIGKLHESALEVTAGGREWLVHLINEGLLRYNLPHEEFVLALMFFDLLEPKQRRSAFELRATIFNERLVILRRIRTQLADSYVPQHHLAVLDNAMMHHVAELQWLSAVLGIPISIDLDSSGSVSFSGGINNEHFN